MTNYFTKAELEDPWTHEVFLAEGAQDRFNLFREKLGFPVYVNCCCRSSLYNTSIGGHPNSFHLMENNKWKVKGTIALDASTRKYTLYQREKFIYESSLMGFSLGIYNNFIHIDQRTFYTELPQVIFNGMLGK